MKLLIIGSVWPEPNSSAAGENMMNIIEHALTRNWQVTFACAAQQTPHLLSLQNYGVECVSIELNNTSFNHFVQQLSPNIVIFDRFMTEEQFSWRVNTACPNALRVLNSEDSHGLRDVRHKQLTKALPLQKNSVVIREAAAILRSDITMLVSSYELAWLHEHLSIPKTQLIHAPLYVKTKNLEKEPSQHAYHERKHISFIGNFKHAPNWDAVLQIHKLWPQIKKRLVNAQCHIYGAYPPPKATALTNKEKGFYVKGWVNNADKAFHTYRLCFAPLRFGAGIKGKLLRSILTATPSVTTPIGIEGITNQALWPGSVATTDNELINKVCDLYADKATWQHAQDKALALQQTLASNEHLFDQVFEELEKLAFDIDTHRNKHFLSRVINQESLRSHKFMSQWIEAKTQLSKLI